MLVLVQYVSVMVLHLISESTTSAHVIHTTATTHAHTAHLLFKFFHGIFFVSISTRYRLANIYFITNPNSLYGDVHHRIFDGKNDNTRFGKNLHSFIAKLSAEDRNILNGLIDNIGSQSGRKGAGSYVLGQVAGPNPVTVSLRMGHSIGNVSPHLVYVYGN